MLRAAPGTRRVQNLRCCVEPLSLIAGILFCQRPYKCYNVLGAASAVTRDALYRCLRFQFSVVNCPMVCFKFRCDSMIFACLPLAIRFQKLWRSRQFISHKPAPGSSPARFASSVRKSKQQLLHRLPIQNPAAFYARSTGV